ncbi:MAG: alpha/beta hydrolase [Chrysiogenetes bacterium]|nr:alpha/beta hydrolase [Chrysiogenetes bacterium]
MIITSPIEGVHPESVGEHRFVDAIGMRFHYVEKGEGEPVLFLHGFPENWFSWHRQMDALAKYYRVIALDLRGYGQSQVTKDGYDANTFASDLYGILDALGIKQVSLVGHDWGALLMWRFVFAHPERCRRVASLNTPHLLAFEHIINMSDAKIARRLWQKPQFAYVPFMRARGLAEAVLNARPRDFLINCFRLVASGRRLPLSSGELHYYHMLYSRPNSWHGPLAYYRSAPLSGRQSAGDKNRKLQMPVLFLMGQDDPLLPPKLVDPMRPMLGDLTVHQIGKAGHWPHLEQPDEVSRALSGFFR